MGALAAWKKNDKDGTVHSRQPFVMIFSSACKPPFLDTGWSMGIGCMYVQKSERPGVFVGILRAGLGPFLQQAAGLLLTRSESTKVCPELSLTWELCLNN